MLRFRLFARRLFIPAAALAAVAVAPPAAQAGPVRQFVAGVCDRAQERQEARRAARGCQPPATAFPAAQAAPAAVTYTAAGTCEGGACAAPAQGRRR